MLYSIDEPTPLKNELAGRVKDQLPTVLLTLLSIVQALALELMWEHVTTAVYLYEFSFVSLLGWVQTTATLLGILLVWLIYSTMVMRFRWVPTTVDLIFPFLVGILEFILVATLEPSQIGIWFLTLGVIFGAMTWSSQSTLKRARLDGENIAYFADITPAQFRDFLPALLTVSGLIGLGFFIWVTENQGWIALVGLAIATAVLAVQMKMTDTFWRRTFMRIGEN